MLKYPSDSICILYYWPEQFSYRIRYIYYPPEVRRGEYLGLGVFLLQYFPLVKILTLLHYNCINMNIVG